MTKLISVSFKPFYYRDDLASIIGTATESAMRMLSEFRKESWIKIEGGKIEMIDINKLRSVKY